MNKFKFLPFIAAAAVITGCQEYDFGVTSDTFVRKEYAENFEKLFGTPDPDHTWITSTCQSVTVSTDKESEIKIYGSDGVIVADYQNVIGKKTLTFDLDNALKEVYVSNGQSAQKVEVGGYVSFASTRAGNYGWYGAVNIEPTGEYIEYGLTEAREYAGMVPENTNNLKKADVTPNFQFISTGSFVIHPIYWQTGAVDAVGIYYTDSDGEMHKQLIYTIKSGNELQKKEPNSEWAPCTSITSAETFDDPKTLFRSYGIKVDIPAGTVFGMYLVHANNEVFYSDANLNTAFSATGLMHDNTRVETFTDPLTPLPYASTFEVNGHMYLGFEDWACNNQPMNDYGYLQGSTTNIPDMDLNDVIFRFEGQKPIVVDNEAETFYLAYEDLGSTFDFDFNDVVLAVEHLAGQESAKVRLMAGGGTLATEIVYGEETLWEEYHATYGVELSTPVNVGGYTSSTTPTKEITVESTFSMSNDASKFKIIVSQNSTSREIHVPVHGNLTDAPYTHDGTDNIPQGICIKAKTWSWPKEMVCITEVYPDFVDWITDATHTDWAHDAWDLSTGENPSVPETDESKIVKFKNTVYDTMKALEDANNAAGYTKLENAISTEDNAGSSTYPNTVYLSKSALQSALGSNAGISLHVVLRLDDYNNGAYSFVPANGVPVYGAIYSPDHTANQTTQYATDVVISLTADQINGLTDKGYPINVNNVVVSSVWAQTSKLTPVITMTTPSSVTMLASTDAKPRTFAIAATANCAGTFSYEVTTGSSTVNTSGVITATTAAEEAVVTVTFTPSDAIAYNTATATVNVSVVESLTSDFAITSGSNMTVVISGDNYGSEQITWSTSSRGAVTFSGYDSEIITVSESGLVTAVAPGTTTITVNLADDTDDTGYSADSKTVSVTVAKRTELDLTLFNLDTGKGHVNASIFGDATSANVTIEYKEAVQNGNNVFYGYTSSNSGDTWGTDAPGNVYSDGTSKITFTITEAQMTQVKTNGWWGYEFKKTNVKKMYFE